MIFSPQKLLQARIWLLTAICFVLPMKASFVYVLSAFLLVVWLLEGSYAERLRAIFQSKLCLAFLAYYAVYIVAMLWTEDLAKGWAMVDRQTPFLLFLLYWSSAEPTHRERYISALIAGLGVCALIANYNLLQMHLFTSWPPGIRVVKDPFDTAPFVDRILYTPILALGAYFCLTRIFKTTGSARVIAILMACLLIFNLSFSGGRSGMVMFVALFVLFVFQRIRRRGLAILVCAIVLPTVFITAYKTQSYFAERVDVAMSDMRSFNDNPDTSVGLRLVYWTTSFHVFTAHPLIGVGSGDFQREYTAAKPVKWAATPDSFNPHNQFLMTAVTTGLIGLALLLAIFYQAARVGCDTRMTGLLVGFAVVCLFESYLWRSNTALAFCAMVAVLANKNKAIAA
jgi:O-antigen ligase